MHRELHAVFAEHAEPTHASKRDVHDQMAPLMTMGSAAERQLAEYESLIVQAELAPHDHALDGKLEMMHQTIRAGRREIASMLTHGRDVARVFTQLDRCMAAWREDIATYLASAAAPESPASPVLSTEGAAS